MIHNKFYIKNKFVSEPIDANSLWDFFGVGGGGWATTLL